MAKGHSGGWRLVSSALALAAGMAGPALAQEAAPAPDQNGVNEVVVTAQRFEQTIREVPISVAALNSEQLDNLGIDDLKDVTGQIPNLFINNFNGRSDTVRIFIRGIGQNDVSLTQDPSVALYIDNVYVGSAIGSSFDSMDLERIEVLRGPQGTLYGRNSTGGAVNLIPKKPQLGQFHATAEATGGNFNLRSGRIGLNVPIGNDLAFKIDAGRLERDGWVTNNGPGDDFSAQNRRNIRGALRWQPSDSLTVDYSYDWSQVKDTQPFTTATALASSTIGAGPDGGALFRAPGTDAFTALTGAEIDIEVRQNDPQISEHRPDSATSLRPVQEGNSQISGHALNISWDVSPDLTLRSITGYRQIDVQFLGDYLPTFEGRLLLNGTIPVSGYGSLGGQELITHFHNISQEFQALGTAHVGGGDLRYVGGLYYYTQTGSEDGQSVFVVPRGFASAEIDDKSWAAFGEGTFTPNAFDKRLHITLGGRYSHDERSAIRTNEGSIAYARLGGLTDADCANQAFLGQFAVGECPAAPGGVVQAATFNKDFNNFSGSGSVTWELTPDVNIYGRVAQGYKTGGTSERSADPVLFGIGYVPEKILSYEVGLKGLYFEHRLALNAAVFYMTLDHFQTSVQTGATPGDRDFVGLDGNSYKGLEADATWRATQNLTFNASLGLLETEVGPSTVSFDLAPGGICTGTLSGNTCTQNLISQFAYAPKRTITFGANYDRQLAENINFSAAINYAYQSEAQTSLNVFENTTIDQRGLWDGSVVFRFPNTIGSGEASVRIWGRNLADQDYRIVDNRSFNFVGAARQAEWGEPRTFGVTLGYSY